MDDDTDFVRGHEKAIENQESADFFRRYPERVKSLNDEKRLSSLQKFSLLDERFQLLVPFIKNTKNHLGSITEKTKLSASFLLFHKTIQAWEAMQVLAKQGFYNQVMELARSTSESMDLANMFILDDTDGIEMTHWFNGETIGNRLARESFEKVFNDSQVLPDAVPIKKTLAAIYDTMSKYTHSSYGAMLEMIDVFTKDFDFGKSASFHRLDEQSDVLNSLINKIQFALFFYYLKLVNDHDSADKIRQIISSNKTDLVTEEEAIEHFKKYQS